MILYCWPHQSVTFKIHWNQQTTKRPAWRSATSKFEFMVLCRKKDSLCWGWVAAPTGGVEVSQRLAYEWWENEVWNGQEDWVQTLYQALNSPVGLCTILFLWTWALGSYRKSEVMDTSGWNELTELSLKDRVMNSVILGELRVELMLLCIERSQTEVVWSSCLLNISLWRSSGHAQLERGRAVQSAAGIIYPIKEDLESVARERNAWNTLLTLLPLQPKSQISRR